MPKKYERLTAECGKHFCERCGDCLHCYGEEYCYNGGFNNGEHLWPQELIVEVDDNGKDSDEVQLPDS